MLRLKRNDSKTGYKFVYKIQSKKNPFQAMVVNKRTGKQQSIGLFPTAQSAAVHIATVLSQGDDDDLPSPRKRQKRGELPLTAWHHPHACSTI
jgi:hypothetical protein